MSRRFRTTVAGRPSGAGSNRRKAEEFRAWARYTGPVCKQLPPGGHEALPQGRPLLHGQVRRSSRGSRLPACTASAGRRSRTTACSFARSSACAACTACRKASSAASSSAPSRGRGVTGEKLLQMLELRLDNVVYRLGFAPSRRAARQFVLHGHVQVNGRKATHALHRSCKQATWSRCATAPRAKPSPTVTSRPPRAAASRRGCRWTEKR